MDSDEDKTRILEIYKEIAMEKHRKMDIIIWICFIGAIILFMLAGVLV